MGVEVEARRGREAAKEEQRTTERGSGMCFDGRVVILHFHPSTDHFPVLIVSYLSYREYISSLGRSTRSEEINELPRSIGAR